MCSSPCVLSECWRTHPQSLLDALRSCKYSQDPMLARWFLNCSITAVLVQILVAVQGPGFVQSVACALSSCSGAHGETCKAYWQCEQSRRVSRQWGDVFRDRESKTGELQSLPPVSSSGDNVGAQISRGREGTRRRRLLFRRLLSHLTPRELLLPMPRKQRVVQKTQGVPRWGADSPKTERADAAPTASSFVQRGIMGVGAGDVSALSRLRTLDGNGRPDAEGHR